MVVEEADFQGRKRRRRRRYFVFAAAGDRVRLSLCNLCGVISDSQMSSGHRAVSFPCYLSEMSFIAELPEGSCSLVKSHFHITGMTG